MASILPVNVEIPPTFKFVVIPRLPIVESPVKVTATPVKLPSKVTAVTIPDELIL